MKLFEWQVGFGGVGVDLLATVESFPKPDTKNRTTQFKVHPLPLFPFFPCVFIITMKFHLDQSILIIRHKNQGTHLSKNIITELNANKICQQGVY